MEYLKLRSVDARCALSHFLWFVLKLKKGKSDEEQPPCEQP